MHISSSDISSLVSLFQKELAADNGWLAHNNSIALGEGDMQFFKTAGEAVDFCLSNYSDRDEFTRREILPLCNVLQKIEFNGRQDVDYYSINRVNEVSFVLKINPDQNPLHNPDGNDFTDALIDSVERREGVNNYSLFKCTTMNEQNLEYLKNTLKYMGFEDRLNEGLERSIQSGTLAFTLNDTKQFNNVKTDSILYFSKGKENETYFFNKYDVAVTKADGRSESQTMYMNRVTRFNEETGKDQTRLSGFTLKEAANLLDRDANGMGRAVYKEFVNKDNESYMAWKQVDFTQQEDSGNYKYKTFHQNYGYNLEKALDKYSILEDKSDVMKSLQKGNLQAVTVEENGNNVRRFLAADPENKVLKVFDEKGREIKQEVKSVNLATKQREQNAERNNSVSKEVKQDGAKTSEANGIGEGQTEASKKNSSKKGKVKGDDDGDLLEKKRESNGKGMKV